MDLGTHALNSRIIVYVAGWNYKTILTMILLKKGMLAKLLVSEFDIRRIQKNLVNWPLGSWPLNGLDLSLENNRNNSLSAGLLIKTMCLHVLQRSFFLDKQSIFWLMFYIYGPLNKREIFSVILYALYICGDHREHP